MGGQHVEVVHLRPHRHVFAMDLDAVRSRYHGGAARSSSLKAGEENGVLGVGSIALEVVQHAPAGRHTTGGNDHLRPRIGGESLRFLDTADVAGDRAGAATLDLGELVILETAAEQLAGVHRHWTVKEDG